MQLPKGSHLTHLTSTTLRQRRPEASRASPQSYKISETISWIRTRPNLCPTNWTSGFTLGLGKATRVWYGMISTWLCTWNKNKLIPGNWGKPTQRKSWAMETTTSAFNKLRCIALLTKGGKHGKRDTCQTFPLLNISLFDAYILIQKEWDTPPTLIIFTFDQV